MGEVSGQDRKGPPRKREPEVAVQASAEKLQVVRKDEEHAGGDERQERWPDHGYAGKPEADRAHEARDRRCPEHPGGDLGAQRTAAQLIQRVGRDPNCEQERNQARAKPPQVDVGSEARPDQDV